MLQTLRSTRGMVTSSHHLAAEAGLQILREGGNAIEAMVVDLTNERRPEIEETLATNGLSLLPGSERIEVTFPGEREMRILVDQSIGAARIRLPDMRIVLSARIEQDYNARDDSISDR